MSDPKELKYSKTHEWVRVEGEEAVVGITQFAQDALGDITYVEVPAEGDAVEQEKECGSVESVKAASDLISPPSTPSSRTLPKWSTRIPTARAGCSR